MYGLAGDGLKSTSAVSRKEGAVAEPKTPGREEGGGESERASLSWREMGNLWSEAVRAPRTRPRF